MIPFQVQIKTRFAAIKVDINGKYIQSKLIRSGNFGVVTELNNNGLSWRIDFGDGYFVWLSNRQFFAETVDLTKQFKILCKI